MLIIGRTIRLNLPDFKERKNWDAYQDALSRTSTENASWYVIPANQKWFRDYMFHKRS